MACWSFALARARAAIRVNFQEDLTGFRLHGLVIGKSTILKRHGDHITAASHLLGAFL